MERHTYDRVYIGWRHMDTHGKNTEKTYMQGFNTQWNKYMENMNQVVK